MKLKFVQTARSYSGRQGAGVVTSYLSPAGGQNGLLLHTGLHRPSAATRSSGG
jgi:hypothetical protein